MHPERKNIRVFLFTPDRYFEIPDFQRPYSWNSENVQAFLDDLEEVKATQRAHYFGSIVYIIDGKSSTIIDGQQRATTVLLMLTALYHLLLEDPSRGQMPAEQIKDNYLINRYGDEKNRIKLRTVTIDDEIFKKIFEQTPLTQREKESKLYGAYTNFYEYFSDKDKLETYVDALEHFEIVDILLEASDDNPQRIFESINSTGEPLSDGDKIRNYALMLGDKTARDLVFENYWKKIENELSDVNEDYITDFFRAYMTAKSGRDVKMYNVYKEFKELFTTRVPETSDVESLQTFYDEIFEYLDCFLFLKFPTRKDNDIFEPLTDAAFRINYLKVESTYPFFINVLMRLKRKELAVEEVAQIFSLIETILVRRIICSITTQGLNKVFVALDKDVENYWQNEPSVQYIEILKYVLLEKRRSGRTPRNEEVAEAIVHNEFYEQRRYNVNFVLSSIDDKTQSRESFLLQRFAQGDQTLSIEHVMPQSITEQWKKELGPNFSEIHQKFLHTLANLTITGYNSKYSNKSFTEKKETDNGFIQSPLLLNTYIKEQTTWSQEQLAQRQEWWKQQVEKLWPCPTSSFVPPVNTTWISLNSEEELVGRKIQSVQIFGTAVRVTTWVDALDVIAETLYDKHPNLINEISTDAYLSKMIKIGTDGLRDGVEIYDTGIFLEVHMHNERKRIVLTRLMECLNEDPSEIEFEVLK